MDLSTDVLFTDGQDNMGGLTKRAYIGFEGAFTSLSTPVANPATYGARVTITDNHVLANGKKLIELYIMYDKSGIESPLVGSRKAKSYKPTATYFYPGNDADCIGFQDLIKNSDLITFNEQQDGDGYIQIGTRKLPASLVAGSVKTGVGPEGEKGIMFEIEAPSRAAYYLYTGDLPRVGAAV
jgi:hypothetical protein